MKKNRETKKHTKNRIRDGPNNTLRIELEMGIHNMGNAWRAQREMALERELGEIWLHQDI